MGKILTVTVGLTTNAIGSSEKHNEPLRQWTATLTAAGEGVKSSQGKGITAGVGLAGNVQGTLGIVVDGLKDDIGNRAHDLSDGVVGQDRCGIITFGGDIASIDAGSTDTDL